MPSQDCPTELNDKQCRICLKWKPATVVYFTKSKDSIGGISRVCKPCTVILTNEYVRTHRKEVRTYQHQHYLSNQEPLKEKSRLLYWKDPGRARTTNLAWREDHPEEVLAYRSAHREERNTYCREYDAEHREEKRLYNQEYYAEHPELFSTKHKTFHAANPGKASEYTKRRRALKSGAPINDLTHAQWLQIQEAQNHCCAYCKKRCKGHLTQDHITPYSKGGSHTLHNVVGACKPCNSRKHTGPPLAAVQPLLLSVPTPKKQR